ncbi:MAG: hypothetical protein BECKG1743D_GA0114223_106821, partial [Candidatus Kentron sp. G]
MLDEMDILHEMIRENAKVSIEESNGRRQVTLGEPRDSEGRKVKISGLPDDAIVINADEFPAPDAVFTCRKGECKRADFIIIADTGKKRVILCCYGSRYFGGSVPHTGRGNRGTSRQPDSAHGQRILALRMCQ